MNTNRIFRFLAFLILSVASHLVSQTVTLSGAIKDSATAAGIDSVRVDIVNTVDPGEKYTVYTNSTGAWSYTFINTSVGNNPTAPISFSVQQNFPNPFNPSTVIPFTLHRSGIVTLTVHNILGQLMDERSFDLSAGHFNVRWSSIGAAGVYLYTVRYGNTAVTRKMIQMDGGYGDGIGDAVLAGGVSSVPNFSKNAAADYTVVASRIGYEPDSTVVSYASNPQINFSLSSVHHRAFVFDLHNDIAELMVDGYQMGIRNTNRQSDIPRFIDGGVDAQMIVLWPDPNEYPTTSYQRTVQMYDTCIAQFNRNSTKITQTRTIAEIQSANQAGKIAAVLCVEGGTAINNSLANLYDLYDRGARYMTITWNNSFDWATSAADPLSATKGLSDFGKEVIRAMDSIGMIIDVSHTGIKTIEDILSVTKNPIIASHSGCRTLRNHTRNLTDTQIQAIAAGGGVIGVVFHRSFLTSTSTSTIDTVIGHIDYIKNLVGIDYVALGSDYDGGITAPTGLENVSKLPNLTMALLKRGYSKSDVLKILGENYLRVFNTVCK
ncbi:MAG: membrane dipeptidase [Bacteroidota bacterium]